MAYINQITGKNIYPDLAIEKALSSKLKEMRAQKLLEDLEKSDFSPKDCLVKLEQYKSKNEITQLQYENTKVTYLKKLEIRQAEEKAEKIHAKKVEYYENIIDILILAPYFENGFTEITRERYNEIREDSINITSEELNTIRLFYKLIEFNEIVHMWLEDNNDIKYRPPIDVYKTFICGIKQNKLPVNTEFLKQTEYEKLPTLPKKRKTMEKLLDYYLEDYQKYLDSKR